MRDETGFTPVGDFATGELAPQVGVGILGYAFMGKAHSNAYRKIPYIMDPPPAVPVLIAMYGRQEDAVARAARRYGYQGYYTDWHKMLENDDIQLVDNSAPPFMHHDPCVMAVQAGKHVLCEKPLARTAQEAKAMWEAAQKSEVLSSSLTTSLAHTAWPSRRSGCNRWPASSSLW
ncbi:MAG: Gfo/Idh/MocA family oxidoreductase, partial [Anaerolineae bacterium]|nr:Gfo/Idh/MocA family oxidoreductase [Anaerolineae bacterium]